MIGGQIRGQGTYGCVFQPALLCRGSDSIEVNPKKVGKVTSVEDARNELSVAKYLQTIPDASKYTIIAESKSCKPRSKSKQVEKDIKQCEFIKDMSLEETTQIIMPWGGVALNMVNLNPRTFDFFRFMEEILAIGAFLVLNDLCHFDIYGQNFLFDSNTKPKLIDFGFAFRPSKLELSDLGARWRMILIDHDTETPEVTLMLGAFKGISPSTLIRELEMGKPVVQRLAVLCDLLPSEWAADLTEWSSESQSFQEGDWLACWKLYWPGFDAWGLGATILQVLEIQMSVPRFAESSEWKKRGETVKAVLRGLCAGHPAFRLDAVEALSLLTNASHPLVSAGSVGDNHNAGDAIAAEFGSAHSAGKGGAAWISEKQKKRPLV